MERIGSKPTEELVRLAQEDCGTAFTALWDRHIDQLRSYLRSMKRLSGFDIDDICSRSFEKAFRQIGTYDPEKSRFSTWLKTIAHNTALDFIDKENRAHLSDKMIYIEEGNLSPAEVIPEPSRDALETIISNEDNEEKLACINALPPLYRDVAYKRIIEQMPYKEIAEGASLEVNTVKTRVRRARQMIDEMLSAKAEEEAGDER